MSFKRRRRGVTLVELIISIAILGIISISVLSMFSFGFIHVTRAGQRTEATYVNHGDIEIVLNSKNENITDDYIEIQFNDSTKIESKGSQKSKIKLIDGGEVELYYFHPQY